MLTLSLPLNVGAASIKPYIITLKGEATAEKPFVQELPNGLYFKVLPDQLVIDDRKTIKSDKINFVYFYNPPYRNHNQAMIDGSYGVGLLAEFWNSPRRICFLADPEKYDYAQKAMDSVLWPYSGKGEDPQTSALDFLAQLPQGEVQFTIKEADIDGKDFKSFDEKNSLSETAKTTRIKFDVTLTYPAKKGVCGIDTIVKEQQS